ncbi:DNA-directed RNA polymerase sigma-70 factor [Planotetraspora thailandica]|uniref:DNA-directed RNA polymerase sigma-70 factor n=1 Tax=Planotetraspora thailandica TaxID=487172 RepID=A0A8J3VFT6_9ACTN|nr:SigE family RNA polymerase sigma factor [Planotetraspora thailandica]GII57780.1 DNA-directed RNA polymerase sigma-70 factor [Planotetraspora thailandica]
MTPPAEGFADFVAARATALLRTAYLTCESAADAEDVLQSALERAYRNWHRLRRDADPEPYVRKIIVNLAISRARRRAILRLIPVHAPPDMPVPRGDVELRQVLLDALRMLPPRQRAVMVLRYWEDMTEAQTARILGCSVGTVKSQASKALARLRVLLDREVVINVEA